MNRGTARSNARAVVLPDALLKFEELRGLLDGDDSPRAGEAQIRGPTLLDFMAQALVDEAGVGSVKALKEEADHLMVAAFDAKSVSIDETEASCRQICTESKKAQRLLEPAVRASADSSASAALDSAAAALRDRVRRTCVEAEDTAKRAEAAKEEVAATQAWSAARGGTKGEDWFRDWGAFFEQLSAALVRARPPRPAPPPQPAEPAVPPRMAPVPAARAPL